MITNISSTIKSGERLTIPLAFTSESEFTIINITGTDSPKAILNTLRGSGFDGEVPNSQKADKRTIVLTLAINGVGETEESIRKSLYKWFPSKHKIKFGVQTTSRSMVIDAYVESIVINMFAPIENAQITLSCPYPYFNNSVTSVYTFYGTVPMFEFEFSNESLTEDLLIMSELVETMENVIDYNGDEPCGVILKFFMMDRVQNISIYNSTYNESIVIDTSYLEELLTTELALGDEIIINTKVGSKSVKLYRDGIFINAINSIALFPTWIYLYPGENRIVTTASSGILELGVEISYEELYQGV